MFLEHLCSYVIEGKIRHVRTLIVKDFIGELSSNQSVFILILHLCVYDFFVTEVHVYM